MEGVVGFVLKKLDDIIQKERNLLGGVGKNVERVQRELTRIKCYLKVADSKRKKDESVQNWLNELRDVAYCIEDATDTFFLQVDDSCQADPNFLKTLKNMRHMPHEKSILHKLGKELDDILKVLEEIYNSRVNLGLGDLKDKNTEEAVRMPLRKATYSQVDENEVVGMQVHIDNILKLLPLEKKSRRTVITIVGTGGLGKTTLAHMIYRSAWEKFEYQIMLSISQKYNITDLVTKMLLSCNDSLDEKKDIKDLIGELNTILKTKRYLIILDDVWTVNLWNELQDVLPDVKNGSCVVMTSRKIEVAKSAGPIEPYMLGFLNDGDSLDLLIRKAFFYQKPNNIECLEVAKELSKKCKGLPLALMVVGGILSTKEHSSPVWERVLRTMDWHFDGEECMQILAMSYEDMPYYLKACFLYLASFPEDYEISAKRLIKMWVAEGFLPHEGSRRTMEEMAEDCLEELFQRCMVQVSSRHSNGTIKYFKVHDLLRDLAMHEARQENFAMVFSQESDFNRPNKRIRRASLQYQYQTKQSNLNIQSLCTPEYINPKTRSLLLFSEHLPKFSNFKLLKVLELVGVKRSSSLLFTSCGLDELIHLKYLGFRNCEIGIFSCSFSRMKSLETLDVRGNVVNKLPKAFWTIGTLRHVLCDNVIKGPVSTTDLRNLQTMRWISPQEEWNTELPYLNNMCKLGVHNCYQEWDSVISLLRTMPSLVSLGIKGNDIPEHIIYPKALEKLQSLYLNGKWVEKINLEASLFPPHLVKLTLVFSKLKQNPMPELGKLKSLKKLCLRKHVLNYSGSIICPEGFPVLQYLQVGDELMKVFTVKQGVMPKLAYLQVHANIKLQLPRELQDVTVFKNY